MGKGSRNRELRISENKVTGDTGVKLSKKQLIKKQEKAQKIKNIVSLIAVLAIIAILVVVVVVSTVGKTIKLDEIAATSEYYEVDDAMMTFYTYNYYQNFVSSQSDYLSYLGLSTQTSLKNQSPNSLYCAYILGETPTGTWFDYFVSKAKEGLSSNIALATEARKAGMELTKEDNKTIKEYISSMKKVANENNLTFSQYASAGAASSGVTDKAVKKCLEIDILANKYFEEMTGKYEFTDAEKEAYLKEHPSTFYHFDYISYTYSVESEDGASDDQKKADVKAAEDAANAALEKITDADAFKKLINEVEAQKAAEEAAKKAETADSAADTGDSGSDSEEEEEDEDYAADHVTENGTLSEDSDLFKWAYTDGSFKKAGEKTVIENKSGDDVTGYTVYLLTKDPYIDDYATRNVRHILYETSNHTDAAGAKKAAEDALAGLTADGKVTEEEVKALAEAETEDPGSKENGGLYENVVKGYMVEEFNDWLFADGRKAGDYGIVETDYGAHIMYLVSDGETAWKYQANNLLFNEKYDEDLAALKEKHPVTFDDEAIALIP